MFRRSLFPLLAQFLFDADTEAAGETPTLHLNLTVWLVSDERRIVIPVNTAPVAFLGERLGYMTFEATGVRQAGLEAFQLVDLSLEQPSGLPLSTYQQVFSCSDHRQIAKDFLGGIVPHG